SHSFVPYSSGSIASVPGPEAFGTEIPDIIDAAKRHGDVHFAPQDGERRLDPLLTHGAKAIGKGAADKDAVRTAGDGFQRLLSGLDSAVEIKREIRPDSATDQGQGADGRRRAVKLTPAVVRHKDRGATGIQRAAGVLGIVDAFKDHRPAPFADDLFDPRPVKPLIELARGPVHQITQTGDPACMADDIAKAAPARAQHPQGPAGMHRDINEVWQGHARWRGHAVL